jgi:hypothetical protein
LAEPTGKPDLGGVKRNGITGLLPEVTWSEAFRERVVLMPSISSDFAARLAADFIARGARLFYGHSDSGFPPGHIEIDTRQLDGLRTFYRKVAAENAKIDLYIHCLAKQPVTDAEERFESGLDARTVFVGTLLAAQYLKTKEGIGTILNLALPDAVGFKDLAMVGPAVDLVFDVTLERYLFWFLGLRPIRANLRSLRLYTEDLSRRDSVKVAQYEVLGN